MAMQADQQVTFTYFYHSAKISLKTSYVFEKKLLHIRKKHNIHLSAMIIFENC